MNTNLTRPIVGIENRTAQEVFDIMCDRVRAAADVAYQAGTHEAIVRALLTRPTLPRDFVPCDTCRNRGQANGAAPCNRCIRFDCLEIGDPTP